MVPCEDTQEVCMVAAGCMGADMADVGRGICWGWALPRDPSWGGWDSEGDMPRGPWGGSRWGHASGHLRWGRPSIACACACAWWAIAHLGA